MTAGSLQGRNQSRRFARRSKQQLHVQAGGLDASQNSFWLPAQGGVFFSLLSKICGLIPVPEVVLTCDKGQVPSLRKCGSHRIVWLPLGSCC
jgi:hypothetical protein